MTLIIYEPGGPAVEFIGHAGAGLYGQDPVCAALSVLMYTLIEAVPDAEVRSGNGWCRVDAGAEKNQIGAQRIETQCPISEQSPAERGFRRPSFTKSKAPALHLRGGAAEGASFPVYGEAGRSGACADESGTARASSDAGAFSGGKSSVKPDVEAAFAVILSGLRLLADNFPQYVRLEVKP